MSVRIEAMDDKRRPYTLVPVQQTFNDLPEYSGNFDAIFADADRQLEFISNCEKDEGRLRFLARKGVDLSLSGIGTFATGAVVAYETFTHDVGAANFIGEWAVTIASGLGGAMAHEYLRRPVVGARALYHAWRNPFSPAAQSNERIRQGITET